MKSWELVKHLEEGGKMLYTGENGFTEGITLASAKYNPHISESLFKRPERFQIVKS